MLLANVDIKCIIYYMVKTVEKEKVYKRTLDSFRKGVKVAKREIDDEALLSKVLDKFLELERILNGTGE